MHLPIHLPEPFDLWNESDMQRKLREGADSRGTLSRALEAVERCFELASQLPWSEEAASAEVQLLRSAEVRRPSEELWPALQPDFAQHVTSVSDMTPDRLAGLLQGSVDEEGQDHLLDAAASQMLRRFLRRRTVHLIDWIAPQLPKESQLAAAAADLGEAWWPVLPHPLMDSLLKLVGSAGEAGLPILRQIGMATVEEREDVETPLAGGLSMRAVAATLRTQWFEGRGEVDPDPVPGFETGADRKTLHRSELWNRVSSWFDDRNDLHAERAGGPREPRGPLDTMELAALVASSSIFVVLGGGWLLPGSALDEPWGVMAVIFALLLLIAFVGTYRSTTQSEGRWKKILGACALFSMGFIPLSYVAPHLLNRYLGSWAHRELSATVVERYSTKSPRVRVEVDDEDWVIFGGFKRGDTVVLRVRDGLFGWRWMVDAPQRG